MKITHHGGKCCAIKHIHGLYDTPDMPFEEVFDVSELQGEDVGYLKSDRMGGPVSSDKNIYTGDIEELEGLTMGEVFDIYLRFLMKFRPYGLVEATIVPTVGETAVLNSFYERESETAEGIDLLPVFDEENESITRRNHSFSNSSYEKWASFLKARGFNCVSKAPNTNSGNIVHVYHLVMDGEWHKKVGKAGKLDCFDAMNKKKKEK